MSTATADIMYNSGFWLRLSELPFQPMGPLPVRASWLANVERRILGSIPFTGAEPLPQTGRWLEPEVAGQAINLFQVMSDILPGEPYVYASLKGDLVAEFKAPKGKLTTIVGKSSLTSFGVSGDSVLRITFDLPIVNIQNARLRLKQVSDQLR
jgi:hypothetical protein